MNKTNLGDVEIGLTALCLHAQYGQTLTQREIADVCGCTRVNIYHIERRAMRKLKIKASHHPLACYVNEMQIPMQTHKNDTPAVDEQDVLIELSA